MSRGVVALSSIEQSNSPTLHHVVPLDDFLKPSIAFRSTCDTCKTRSQSELRLNMFTPMALTFTVSTSPLLFCRKSIFQWSTTNSALLAIEVGLHRAEPIILASVYP